MSSAARSIEELFPLIEYCRAGNLRAVSEWIAEKKPLDLPAGKKTRRSSPLQIAIEKGFLTLRSTLEEEFDQGRIGGVANTRKADGVQRNAAIKK